MVAQPYFIHAAILVAAEGRHSPFGLPLLAEFVLPAEVTAVSPRAVLSRTKTVVLASVGLGGAALILDAERLRHQQGLEFEVGAIQGPAELGEGADPVDVLAVAPLEQLAEAAVGVLLDGSVSAPMRHAVDIQPA